MSRPLLLVAVRQAQGGGATDQAGLARQCIGATCAAAAFPGGEMTRLRRAP